ncbi:MAG: FAD-dependent oxidoreductase [Bacteroidales bacterium]|nr:FAD-dependent oxidoreductase [Bacteroidales bacterium]
MIDSTGSADVAIAAGASYEFVDASSVAVQGAGLPPVKLNDHYNNTDYTFTDDTDVHDVTRTIVTGTHKFNGIYDVGKLPQTRERRRIISDYRVTAMDMVNKRNYSDTISFHYSSFDTHGYTIDPYFIITPPADSSVNMFVNVPLRALLPKNLENIIVTGLGAGAERDAMPIIRMQPCLQNQGFSVGMLAASSAKAGKNFRSVDIGNVQKEIVNLGILPKESASNATAYPPSDDQIRTAIRAMTNNFEQIELVLWDKVRGLKLLKEEFNQTSDTNLKTKCAIILGFYGDADVCTVLKEEANRFQDWDKGWNYAACISLGCRPGTSTE